MRQKTAIILPISIFSGVFPGFAGNDSGKKSDLLVYPNNGGKKKSRSIRKDWEKKRSLIFSGMQQPIGFPFHLHEAVAVITPRPLFSNSPLEDYFSAEGVKVGMQSLKEVYKLYGVSKKVRAVYPEGGHDFLTEQRKAAYRFLDSELGLSPKDHFIE